ncbi:MAG TPA: hypothetical protein VJ208_02210 [Candidatus Nanoarchaeia archaeon]|nr:hypothetical protein [Candidatus Nanoarchaeia archaeon]
MPEQMNQSIGYQNNGSMHIKDLEEKQNLLKDIILLIGQNLVDFKEENSEKILEMKKEFEKMKQDIDRIKSFVEIISREFDRFARKEDLEILSKQAKMFQPLDFVKKSDLKKIRNDD